MKRFMVWIVCLLCLPLAGCFSSSGEELLAQPKLPRDYIRLQEKIDTLLSQGDRLISPVSGVNRQSVLTVDINNDGTEEALVLVRSGGESGGIGIHLYQKNGEVFDEFAVIPGEGEEIESLQFLDMDNDGGNEIVICWRVGGGALRAIQIYTVVEGALVERISAGFAGCSLIDLDGDGVREVCLIQGETAETAGQVELYGLTQEGIWEKNQAAQLSSGVVEVLQVKNGGLAGGGTALFVTSLIDIDKRVIDIFALQSGVFTNLTLMADSQISEATEYGLGLLPADLDGDGVTECPHPVPVRNGDPGNEADQFWKVDWRSYYQNGLAARTMTTYHNLSDGWYFVLPVEWRDRIVVRRNDSSSGERMLIFSVENDTGATMEDMLYVYTLSGSGREEAAAKDGRFVVLRTMTDVTVACKLAGVQTYTPEQVTEWFRLIEAEWSAGELTAS